MSKRDEQLLIESLSKRIRMIMAQFRRTHDLTERTTGAGHYMLPISLDGRPAFKVLVWCRTPGCEWSTKGGCTFCDFGRDSTRRGSFSEVEIVHEFVEELNKLDPGTRYLHLGPGGSVFQRHEIPPSLRSKIYRAFGRFPFLESLGVETRAELIQDEALAALVDAVPDTVWEVPIGFGLESSNSVVRNVCCNKGESQRVLVDALRKINQFEPLRRNASGRQVVVNADLYVLLKPPFLTEAEAIDDAVSSIEWAFQHGAGTVSIFPVTIKPATLTRWLHDQVDQELPFRYQPPHWLSVFEVLRRLLPAHRARTLVLGQMSGVPHAEGPRGCRYCRPNLEGLAVAHNLTRDQALIGLASQLRCDCYADWLRDMEASVGQSLLSRLPAYLAKLESAFNAAG